MSAPDQQMAIIARALYRGPGEVPAGLMAGARRRVELGLAVHANTMAHARMTAMADSCPRLIAVIGRERFDNLAAVYVAEAATRRQPLIRIAEGFVDWLATCAASDEVVHHARCDAATLAALHASDAPALALSALPGEVDALTTIIVSRHPAVQVVPASGDAALLFTRPALVVHERLIDADAQAMLCHLSNGPAMIGDLLTLARVDAAAALINLLDAGALTRAFDQPETIT